MNNSLKIEHRQSKQFAWTSFISGGLAGIIGKSAIAPIERVKLLY